MDAPSVSFAEATAHVVDDIHPFTVTVGHAVIAGQQAHQVEQHEEQDRPEQAATHGDAGAERGEHRPHGAPENRVTDARQWPHQTDLDAVDRTVVDRRAVGALLFHRHGHAEHRRRHVRVGVEELEVALDRLFAIVIVFRIQAADHRYHREAKPSACMRSKFHDPGTGWSRNTPRISAGVSFFEQLYQPFLSPIPSRVRYRDRSH